MLVALILVPLLAGFLAWIAGRWSPTASRWIALAAPALVLVLVLALWAGSGSSIVSHLHGPIASSAGPSVDATSGWIAFTVHEWIPRLGMDLRLGLDGISLLLIALTGLLGMFAVACSWREITDRVGFFHFNLLWILAGVIGVFLSLDLFLFYFFWELMLVPMAFLIGIWGHENRIYAAIKFFLFTQASGLLMLVAILGLWAAHGKATGTYTFDYFELLGTPLASSTATWLMLGFVIAFAVKLPVVPFHTWLPDAHTEAPTAGSVVLAGLLLKTGGYGLIRFAVPLFPEAAHRFAPTAMALGAFGVLYGAWVAFGQTDLKRLVAYTSVSHLGFVLLGVFAWNALALQGAMLQMICHGLSTGALFIIVGQLQERTHTRDLGKLGGLWGTVPRMAGLGLILALASLGLPGLGNFVAEFLTLVGAFKASVLWTAVATVGLVLATVYSLRVVQGAFHGENREGWELPDLNVREVVTVGVAVAGLLWLGLYPQAVLDVARPALRGLEGPEAEPVVVERSLPGPGGFGEHRRGDGERTRGPLRSTLASTSPGRDWEGWIDAAASPGADAPRAVLPEPPGRNRSSAVVFNPIVSVLIEGRVR